MIDAINAAREALRESRIAILQWSPKPLDAVEMIEEALAGLSMRPENKIRNLVRDGEHIAGVNEVHDWILMASRGDEAAYFCGELSRDCEIDSSVKSKSCSTRNYVQDMAKAGLVSLVQRREPELSIVGTKCKPFTYIIQRTEKPFKRGERQ